MNNIVIFTFLALILGFLVMPNTNEYFKLTKPSLTSKKLSKPYKKSSKKDVKTNIIMSDKPKI
jgi:hypothetical protein